MVKLRLYSSQRDADAGAEEHAYKAPICMQKGGGWLVHFDAEGEMIEAP